MCGCECVCVCNLFFIRCNLYVAPVYPVPHPVNRITRKNTHALYYTCLVCGTMYKVGRYGEHVSKNEAHKAKVISLLSSSVSDFSPVFTSAASKALTKKPKNASKTKKKNVSDSEYS